MIQEEHSARVKGSKTVCRYDRFDTRKRRAKKVPRRNNLQQAAQQACLLELKTCGEFWGNEDAKFRTASALAYSHDAVIGGASAIKMWLCRVSLMSNICDRKREYIAWN